MIVILELFESMTHKFSGAKYPTLSLIFPYIYILKNHFAPNEEENEILDTYFSLIYSSNDEENSDIASDDEYIPSGGTRQHWQYSHRQFHQRRENIRNRVQGQGRSHKKGGISISHPVKPNLDDINTVEYLQPVNTVGLLQKVCAGIFLFLDEL